MTVSMGYLIAVLPLAIFAVGFYALRKRQIKKIFEQPRPPIKITDLAGYQ